MIYLLITILSITQLFILYLNKNNIKKYWNTPKDSIILKPIPKQLKSEDVDGMQELLSNIISSAKDESWLCEFKYGILSSNGYHMIITSPDKLIKIETMIRLGYDNDPRIIKFNIITNQQQLNISCNKYYNQIIVFLWDFIIEKHINENSNDYKVIKSKIDHINKNLKSFNRNNLLNQLLQK
jgi:hypothetical protein